MYASLTASYSFWLLKRSCWTRVTYITSVLRMTLSRLVVSLKTAPARRSSLLMLSGMGRDGGETKLRVTEYRERSLTRECTVLPYFRSPTKVTVKPLTVPSSTRSCQQTFTPNLVLKLLTFSNTEDIKQCLCRVLAGAISSIQDRNRGELGRDLCRANLWMAQNDGITVAP